MSECLKIALENEIWKSHKIGDEYQMDNKPNRWKITYYPIFEDYKGNQYEEPRALIEKPILGHLDMQIGIDFREIPLRYLVKI